MTLPGEPTPLCARCSASSPPPLGGPWAIVYGEGVRSQEAAEDAERQCCDHGVSTRVRAIDELEDIEESRYVALVIALPEVTGRNAATALRPFADLVQRYRQSRPPGLRQIVDGSEEYWDVGVVQIVGPRALVHHPSMAAAVQLACAVHYTENITPANTIEQYYLPTSPAVQVAEDSLGADVLQRLWDHVRQWGVEDPADVDRLLARIQGCIDRYERDGDRNSSLYRPDPAREENRLQLILAGHHDPIGDRKTWMENGARVCRDVIKDMQGVVPMFGRPPSRANTKGAQKEFEQICHHLKILAAARRKIGWSPPVHE